MKRLLLASAACFALSLPAMAATANQPNQPPKTQTQQQSQAANQPSQQANQPQNQAAKSQSANEQQSQAANQPSQSTNQQSQAANQPSSQSSNKQWAEVIAPSKLSREQIREIQLNLNKKGFSTGHVDGIWGSDTRDAVMNFQKSKKLYGHGELTQQTLADLGVNLNNQAQANGSMSNQSANGQAQMQTKPSSAQTNMKSQSGAKAKTP
jgi:hypothetical protein